MQFTSGDFIDELAHRGVRISMDGKGRFLDNIFIERLWRSLKYEEVYIKAYASVGEARGGIRSWLVFYNDVRLHQALGYRTPREMFEAMPTCGYVDNASLVFAVARQTTRFWSVYQRFAGGGFRACVYAGSAAWAGSAILRICLGIDMPSFFSVPASSGVVLVR